MTSDLTLSNILMTRYALLLSHSETGWDLQTFIPNRTLHIAHKMYLKDISFISMKIWTNPKLIIFTMAGIILDMSVLADLSLTSNQFALVQLGPYG